MRLYLDTHILAALLNDRLIIAQAISDKATLVSSDLQFPRYRKYGLSLHQNKR